MQGAISYIYKIQKSQTERKKSMKNIYILVHCFLTIAKKNKKLMESAPSRSVDLIVEEIPNTSTEVYMKALKACRCAGKCARLFQAGLFLDYADIKLNLSFNEKVKAIKSDLINCKSESKQIHTKTICRQYFELKVAGVRVCPEVYAISNSIGLTTLKKAVDNLMVQNRVMEIDRRENRRPVQDNKETKIIAFLERLVADYSEPVPGATDLNERVLTRFYNKKSLYDLMIENRAHGVKDDFEMMSINLWNDPPTFYYFTCIWRLNFPKLICEGDRPQCTECAEFYSKLTNATDDDDEYDAIEKELKKHNDEAKSVMNLSRKIGSASMAHDGSSPSYVIDNMGKNCFYI